MSHFTNTHRSIESLARSGMPITELDLDTVDPGFLRSALRCLASALRYDAGCLPSLTAFRSRSGLMTVVLAARPAAFEHIGLRSGQSADDAKILANLPSLRRAEIELGYPSEGGEPPVSSLRTLQALCRNPKLEQVVIDEESEHRLTERSEREPAPCFVRACFIAHCVPLVMHAVVDTLCAVPSLRFVCVASVRAHLQATQRETLRGLLRRLPAAVHVSGVWPQTEQWRHARSESKSSAAAAAAAGSHELKTAGDAAPAAKQLMFAGSEGSSSGKAPPAAGIEQPLVPARFVLQALLLPFGA
jgi:hypothetical protein